MRVFLVGSEQHVEYAILEVVYFPYVTNLSGILFHIHNRIKYLTGPDT